MYSVSPYCQAVKANTPFLLLILTLVVCCLWNSLPSLYMSHHAMFSPLCFLFACPQASVMMHITVTQMSDLHNSTNVLVCTGVRFHFYLVVTKYTVF